MVTHMKLRLLISRLLQVNLCGVAELRGRHDG